MKSKIKVPTRLSSLLRAQLLLVLLFLMGSGTAFAQLGGTLTATVIKDASPCECDGVVELTLSGCTPNVFQGIWSIYVSQINPLLCNVGEPTWYGDDCRYLSYRMGTPREFMHLEERAPEGKYRIEGLCGGTAYFRVGLSTTKDSQGRYLENYVGDASTNHVEAVTVELEGNTAPPLVCDVQITDCGSCYYQTVSYTAMGGTPPLEQEVREKWTNEPYPMDKPLPRGTYIYKVTDANGCECTKEFTITTDKPLPPVSLKVTPVGCNDEGGCVEIVGDAGGLPIYWDKINTDGSVVELDEHNGETKVCGWQAGDRGVVSIVDRTCVLEFPWAMTGVEPISAALLTKRVVEGNQCYAILEVVNITGGTPGYTIQWDNEAPVPAPGTKKVLLPASVTFTVRDANGCEYSEDHSLTCGRIVVTIYPNPVGDQATAAFHADKLALYNYELFNVSFGLVGGATLGSLMPGDHTFNVNMSTLPSGVYYLLLYEDGIPNSVYVQIVK